MEEFSLTYRMSVSPAARDDQIDAVVEREQLGYGLAPAGAHEHECLLR